MQDEDHEAVKEAVFRAGGLVSDAAADRIARAALDAALSRCPSPERDTERDALQALVDEARADDEWVSGNDLLIRVGALVLDRLSEYSSTTKEKG